MLIQLHITSVLNFDLMILTFNYLFKLVKKTSKYFRIKIWLFFCKHSPSFREDQFRNKYGQDHLALLTNEGFVIKSECTNLIQKDWSTLQEINENNKDKINKYLL